MLKKRLTALIGVILLNLMAASSIAVMPPAPGIEMPPEVKEAQKRFSQYYGGSGIAKRLQRIKQDKKLLIKAGLPISSRTTNVEIPVLMGNYSDVAHTYVPSDFNEHLFGYNPTGSMSDYYDEVSYGQFQLSGTVYGPYTAEETQYFYAYNYGVSSYYPRNSGGFLWSLLEASDADIDFSQFDNDGPDGVPNSGDDDGVVDGITVIFPDGAAEGGDDNNIWSHQWLLSNAAGSMFVTDDPRAGGGFISVERYFVTGAEKGDGTTDVIMQIGVFCHEYGHVLGLPDLYDTDNSSYGVGTWCLMAVGSWGATYHSPDADHRPTHFCAWCKEQLGFITPIDVIGTETIQIPPVENDPNIYRLWDDTFQGERYFLIENRRAIGFDADILGEGLVIWHCNNDVSFSNADDNWRIVDIEEADGLDQIHNRMNVMDPGDPFPGAINITSFNDITYPGATDVFGNPTGVSVEDIAYGPDLDVTATLTQRELLGYTITHHPGYSGSVYKWLHGLFQTTYGALDFTAPAEGILVGVQIGVFAVIPQPYSIRIFNGMVDNSPEGLISTTSGTLPQFYRFGYHEIPLSSVYGLTPGETFLVDMAWGGQYSEFIPYVYYGPYTGDSYFSENGIDYLPQTDKDFAIRARVQYCYDSDGDGYSDAESDPIRCGELDNCPDVFNPDQDDSNFNGIGDACDFICGDANDDDLVNILDIVYIINFKYKEGPAPVRPAYADVNSDELINILDIVYLINFKYKDGADPFCTISK